MSFLLKNRETLTKLFHTFSLQELLLVNQNLTASWHLLRTPPTQLIVAMKDNQASIDTFVGKKCLPLIRFYLAEKVQQKQVFLSKDLLTILFVSLPAVEGAVFKGQIQRALLEERGAIIQLNNYHAKSYFANNCNAHKNKASIKLAEEDKKYLNCFYYLQAGELFIIKEGLEAEKSMLLYSELSPLQQMQAQKLFKLSNTKKNVQIKELQKYSA